MSLLKDIGKGKAGSKERPNEVGRACSKERSEVGRETVACGHWHRACGEHEGSNACRHCYENNNIKLCKVFTVKEKTLRHRPRGGLFGLLMVVEPLLDHLLDVFFILA